MYGEVLGRTIATLVNIAEANLWRDICEDQDAAWAEDFEWATRGYQITAAGGPGDSEASVTITLQTFLRKQKLRRKLILGDDGLYHCVERD